MRVSPPNAVGPISKYIEPCCYWLISQGFPTSSLNYSFINSNVFPFKKMYTARFRGKKFTKQFISLNEWFLTPKDSQIALRKIALLIETKDVLATQIHSTALQLSRRPFVGTDTPEFLTLFCLWPHPKPHLPLCPFTSYTIFANNWYNNNIASSLEWKQTVAEKRKYLNGGSGVVV